MTTTPADRIKQIHARLREIAPYPETGEVAAGDLARLLAVRAQIIFRQQLTPGAKTSHDQIDLMTILYAAAHALAALDNDNPSYGAETATEIRDAWEDGGSVGEWIWAYLGDDEIPAEVGELAEELLMLEADTDILDSVRPAGYDGTTVIFEGASDAGLPDGDVYPDPAPRAEPPARLRAQPRYQPQQPPPAGYAATTGPMPAVGRLAPAIGDALTHDERWGPMLAPLPCGWCGTPPPVPEGILERTRIIGHVNWLAAQAGWRFDYDMTWTCPACQQGEAWRARQGQVEVRWPDGGYCARHDDGAGDRCDCPSARLATDVMLTSHDYLKTGRDISLQILKDTQAGAR